MKFETIKNKKYFLYVLIIGVILIITMVVSASLAKYNVTESINIVSGTINYSPSDLNIMSIYIKNEGETEYTNIDSIPKKGYVFNSEESYCEVNGVDINATITYDIETRGMYIIPMNDKGTKCYLYFDEYVLTVTEQILANISKKSTRSSFDNVLTTRTTGTIYQAEDDDGTTYYFAGAPTDNWVKFAGFWWRIIRINGDGTLRVIYQGDAENDDGSAIAPVTTGTGTQLATESEFNSLQDSNEYIGYMYTLGSVHGSGTSSTIKNTLDNWYITNLSSYSEYIDTNAGFCGDRQPSTDLNSQNGSGGTGTTTTYFGANFRLTGGVYGDRTISPTFKCEYKDDNGVQQDLYTVGTSNKGNKALTVPIGLITADEVAYAGGVYNTNNTSYYLYTGQRYWTISPSSTFMGHALGNVFTSGQLNFGSSRTMYVRPVINLRANTIFKSGSKGTTAIPYEVL